MYGFPIQFRNSQFGGAFIDHFHKSVAAPSIHRDVG